MKQYLLLLAGLMILAPYGRADAKAVKLGRGNAYSVAADANVNTRAGGTQLRKGECEADTECPSDKKCMGYKCVDVCTQPTGNGIRYGRICGGSKCIADPDTPHAFKCVDSCYNVVCKSPRYTTEVSGDSCCCVAISCPSGQRLENSKCVANCTGVTCKSGYKTVSNSTGCCCEEDTPTCSTAQVYHPTLKKCVAAVCPANCSTCDASGSCTKCDTAYLLSSGKCVSCPSNATCSGTSSFSCKSGYEKYNNTCRTSSCNGISSTPLWCQDTHVRVEGKGCCRKGYTANEMCLQCSVRDGVSIRDTSCSDCICGTGGTPYYNGTMCICKGTGIYGDSMCRLL